MSRLELRTGQGDLAVLLDLSNSTGYGPLVPYSVLTRDAVHAAFGGVGYYVSRSGASCAGWVHSHPYLGVAKGCRVDTRYPLWPPTPLFGESRPTIDKWSVVVPYIYGTNVVSYDHPVVVWNPNSHPRKYYFLDASQVVPFFAGELTGEQTEELAWQYYATLTAPVASTVRFQVGTFSLDKMLKRNGMMMIRAAYAASVMKCGVWDPEIPPQTSFFRRLGLRLGSGPDQVPTLYKMRNGVAYEAFPFSAASIREAATKTVAWIAPTIYVAYTDGAWYINGLVTIGDEIVGTSQLTVSFAEAVKLMTEEVSSEQIEKLRQELQVDPRRVDFDKPIVWA
mgnify:CR=1 FL=1